MKELKRRVKDLASDAASRSRAGEPARSINLAARTNRAVSVNVGSPGSAKAVSSRQRTTIRQEQDGTVETIETNRESQPGDRWPKDQDEPGG